MEILPEHIGGNVWQRDVIQQRLRRGSDERWIQDIGSAVELVLLAGLRIENLDPAAIVVGGLAEIAVALGQRWHCRKGVIRIPAA